MQLFALNVFLLFSSQRFGVSAFLLNYISDIFYYSLPLIFVFLPAYVGPLLNMLGCTGWK